SISTPQKQLGREGLFLNIYIPVEVLEGEPARVIKGHVPFEPIWKIIDRVSPVPDASVILLDPFGNMISHRDKSLIFQKFKHWSAEEGREVHEGSWIEADGKRYFCLANVLPSKVTRVGHSWTLLLLIPEKDVLAVAEQ